MREQIIEILEEIKEDVDFTTCDKLIQEGILSSLDVPQLVSMLCDEFDITIPANEIIPDNFNSVDALVELVKRLSDE